MAEPNHPLAADTTDTPPPETKNISIFFCKFSVTTRLVNRTTKQVAEV
jgi:hypothetical protein